MKIEEISDNILEKGFEMPKIKDALMIILCGHNEIMYRTFLFVFYMLGCFKLRYYQISMRPSWYFHQEIKRFVSFHPREWNPLSFIAVIIFSIFNSLYEKGDLIGIEIDEAIIIDIDKNNKAYICNIKK